MPERNGYPQGVPSWVDTSQPDPETAAAFYGGLFGWNFENVMPPDGPKYFMARLRGSDVAGVGSVPEGAPAMALWNTYIAVDSADEAAAKVKAAGGQVVTEPFDVLDAGRMAVLSDPEGAVFCVWQAGRTKGAQVVNEHGTLTFNSLNTRDAASAEEFYGSVFGWDRIDVGNGGEMWALPGYGDILEANSPGMREGMAAMGAPPRFEDVVAALMPIPDDQPDTPPHWSVTFASDDVDATASKATELGGNVVVPPIDAPWVRFAVIADPQGATFVASQFVPDNKDLGS